MVVGLEDGQLILLRAFPRVGSWMDINIGTGI